MDGSRSGEPTVTPRDIAAAWELIAPYVRTTPLIEVDLGFGPVVLKLELTQHSGSFKVRGAFANLLLRQPGPAGVAAASGGNHGAAVAYAAQRLGVKARIFVPTISSPAKIERIRGYGGELTVVGDTYADALAACEDEIARTGALSIHAFDQRETLLGAGSVGLELQRQAPDVATVIGQVGGGGLMGGVAAAYAGAAKIVAAEPELSPTPERALAAGGPADAPVGGRAADSLGPKRIGAANYAILSRLTDKVALVSEAQILAAQQRLWDELRIVAEPGGATAFAALASGLYRPAPGERVAVILSGANTTAVDFGR